MKKLFAFTFFLFIPLNTGPIVASYRDNFVRSCMQMLSEDGYSRYKLRNHCNCAYNQIQGGLDAFTSGMICAVEHLK